MKKHCVLLLCVSVLVLISMRFPKVVRALRKSGQCDWKITDQFTNSISTLSPSSPQKLTRPIAPFSNTLTIQVINSPAEDNEHKIWDECGAAVCQKFVDYFIYPNSSGNFTLKDALFWQNESNTDITLHVEDHGLPAKPEICTLIISSTDWELAPTPTPEIEASCNLWTVPSENIDTSTAIGVNGKATLVRGSSNNATIRKYCYLSCSADLCSTICMPSSITIDYGDKTYIDDSEINNLQFSKMAFTRLLEGNHNISANLYIGNDDYTSVSTECVVSFSVCKEGVTGCGVATPTPLPPCSAPYSCVRHGCSSPYTPAMPNTVGYGGCSYYEDSCCLAPTPPNPDYCYTEPCTRIRGGPSCNIPKCQACNFCRPSAPPILTYTPIPPLPDLTPLCEQVGTTDDFQKKCKDCVERDKGMWTAIGCLPVGGLEVFLRDYLFTFGIGIAGGIAFLYFLYGTFLFLTSAGNAETVAQAKEIIVSALSGLLFIIFSILLLKIVGGDILRIPGFG